MNEVIQAKHAVVAYDPFRARLAELKANNAALVFDYQDTNGNKEARSYVYKLRQTRSAVDKVREAEKAESLKLGRLIDSEAKEIMSEITAMIDVHQGPLDDIERREKERTDSLTAKVQWFNDTAVILAGVTAEQLTAKIAEVEAVVVDASFQEFMALATTAKDHAIGVLNQARQDAITKELEKAELERLRAESEVRERAEREARIAREAEQRAREEGDRKLLEQQEASDRAVREANAARERAERDARETEERLRRETVEKEAKEQREREKREANKKHRAKVNNEAKDALVAGGVPEDHAKLAVTLIAQNSIPQ